jgi:hypothetical protein
MKEKYHAIISESVKKQPVGFYRPRFLYPVLEG